MAYTLTSAAKSAKMTALRDYLADGTLELLTAADVVIVTFGLSPSGGSVSGGVWTVTLDASTVNAGATGTVTKAQIKTSGGTATITGLVVSDVGGGGEVEMLNRAVVNTQPVQITSFTITHG